MRYLVVLLLAAFTVVADAQIGYAPPSGKYVLVPDSGGGVWRLDTGSGALLKCTAGTQMSCVHGM